ncbi:MAG: deoxynucleoside kinase [Deltaproteobacteria bacterium]|nr:MAG: deoxynucleoside kinase [Deltaproteobacteria bacterium]
MHHYIVIEGPLGVGKTSLALKLAEKMNAEALLEDAEENPFLRKFYQDPKKYSFQAQIFFLLRRYQRALDITQMDLFKRTMISDYLFDKDRIFARANLDDDEFWLYEQLFQLLRKRITPPDLVIFLQATTDVLVERIKKRDKKYERGISTKYLDEINQAFNNFFFHYSDSPLLVINASKIDFVNVPEDFEDLVAQIKRMRTGTQYYVPMSSKDKIK